MSQSELTKIFAAIASDLARGPKDELFLDGRAGFTTTLVWAESPINLINSTRNHELALEYLKKCRIILDSVKNHGWSVVTKRAAVEHSAVMADQEWE